MQSEPTQQPPEDGQGPERRSKSAGQIPTPFEEPQIQLAETRLHLPPRPLLAPLCSAEFAAAILQHLIGHADREHLVVLYLDTRHRVTHAHRASIGTATSTLVHPREVFKGACLANAVAIIVGHNHPSGSVSPSGHDLAMTDRLKSAGEVLGIEVLDAIVVGPERQFHSHASGLGVIPRRLTEESERCFQHRKDAVSAAESFVGRDASQSLQAIHGCLDGQEWGPGTLDAIAEVLRGAGFTIAEPRPGED